MRLKRLNSIKSHTLNLHSIYQFTGVILWYSHNCYYHGYKYCKSFSLFRIRGVAKKRHYLYIFFSFSFLYTTFAIILVICKVFIDQNSVKYYVQKACSWPPLISQWNFNCLVLFCQKYTTKLLILVIRYWNFVNNFDECHLQPTYICH